MNMVSKIDRNKMKFIIERNDMTVSGFHFNMLIAGDTHPFLIRHFGHIESLKTGQVWTPIDFLDEHFMQKRSTILNNLIKCLNLKKTDEGDVI